MSLDRSLAAVIGHPPPFADAELAAVEELTVRHARGLDGITRCTGLRRLTLVGCDLPDREPLEGLPGLAHLRVVGCRMASGYQFVELDALATREIALTAFATLAGGDEAGIFAGPDLFTGVPHSPESHEYLVGLGLVRSEYERRLCVQVWQATGDVYGRGLLVRPGPPTVTGTAFDAVRIGAAELERALEDGQDPFQLYRPEAPDPEALLAPEAADPGYAVRAWLHTNEVWGDDAIAIERFAARFPEVRLELADPAAPARYEPLVPYAWALRAKLLRWTLLAGCPPVRLARLPGEAWTIGLEDTEPDPADLLVAAGLVVVGRSDAGRRLAYELADRGHVMVLDEAGFAAGPDARPGRRPAFRAGDAVPGAATAYESQAALLDDVDALAGGARVAAPGPVVTPLPLAVAVRRELRRLGAATPAGPAATWLDAFAATTWPEGRTLRTGADNWTVRWVHAREPGGRLGIAYEEEGQYLWVVDPREPGDDPMVYRVGHDDEDRRPGHGEPLSVMLAGLRVA